MHKNSYADKEKMISKNKEKEKGKAVNINFDEKNFVITK